MVYASGIRLPCVPHLYKSSAPSGFNGDRRSTSLSFLLKKDSFSRTYSHIYLLLIEAFAFIFLFWLLNEFIFTLFFSPSLPDNMNLVILSYGWNSVCYECNELRKQDMHSASNGLVIWFTSWTWLCC